MDYNLDLDIIINYEEDKYVASCSLFPSCLATAKTKKTALKRLSASISNQIKNQLTENLESILLSNQYESVILDPEEKKDEHRIYTLSNIKNEPKITPSINLKEINGNSFTDESEKNQPIHKLNFNISLN